MLARGSSSRRRRRSSRRSRPASRPPTAGSSSSGSSTPRTSSRSPAGGNARRTDVSSRRGATQTNHDLRSTDSRLCAMKATVAETREVAKGTLLVLFAVDGYPDYRPGSYFWVELPDRGHQDEKGLRRHITLVTSPTELGVVGLATRLRDSAFKRTLAELQVGDEVDVEE